MGFLELLAESVTETRVTRRQNVLIYWFFERLET